MLKCKHGAKINKKSRLCKKIFKKNLRRRNGLLQNRQNAQKVRNSGNDKIRTRQHRRLRPAGLPRKENTENLRGRRMPQALLLTPLNGLNGILNTTVQLFKHCSNATSFSPNVIPIFTPFRLTPLFIGTSDEKCCPNPAFSAI